MLRGGYRISYDPIFYNIYLGIATAAPQVLQQTLTGSRAAANPLLAQPLGPAVRNELAPYLTLGVSDPRSFTQTNVTPDFRADHVHQWTFGIQRQIVPNAVVEARYVGNHGANLFQSINGNPLVSGTAAFPNALPSDVTPCPSSQAHTGRLSLPAGRHESKAEPQLRTNQRDLVASRLLLPRVASGRDQKP